MKGKKTGGRVKGTPNKDTPQKKAIKTVLQQHSLAYITPHEVKDEEGKTMLNADGTPMIASDLELDLAGMKPTDRALIEVKLLEFHTPKMQSTSVDVNMQDTRITIEDKLIKLSQDPDE